MGDIIIEVKELNKRYGEREVLKNVSFSIRQGNIVGLLGSNGAGKSTTMNIITGFLSYDNGQILIGGVDIKDDPLAARKLIGYLPEIPPLYRDLKVKEHLLYVAELKKIKHAAYEVLRVMELADIKERKDDFIKNLSKGLQQRVGFAAALIGNPPILIFDEPLVGLDPSESKKTRMLIKELRNEHAIIISSHILSEIEELCNDILMLKDGEIILNNSTAKFRQKKRDEYSVILKGEKEKIEKYLNEFDLVREIEYIGEKENGIFEYKLITKNTRDIRDQLFGFLVSKKLNVYGLSRIESSLEDAFLEAENKEEA